jgi:ABC-type hemin transport system substrate-binding protein
LPRVGGTKNPSVRQILELEPDLVIANREENCKRAVVALRTAGVDVWVTFPQTVRDGVALLRELADLGATAEAVESVVRPVEEAVRAAEAAPRPRPAGLLSDLEETVDGGRW